MIQVTIMDEKGFIHEYKDFYNKDVDGLLKYLSVQVQKPKLWKIEVRKWE